MIKLLHNISLTIFLLMSVFWLAFAILSDQSMQFSDTVANSLPWIFLLIITLVSFRWEKIGGGFLMLFGFFSLYFFESFSNLAVLFGVSVPIIILGCLIMIIGLMGKTPMNYKRKIRRIKSI